MPTVLAVVLMALELAVAAAVAAVPAALPGCPEACGSVTVPYPFGFRQGCFHAGFNLTCDVTHHPHKLLLGDGVEVDAISLADNTVRVRSKILNYQYNTSLEYGGSWSAGVAATGTIVVSTQHNVFVAVGCGLIAHLVPSHGDGDDRAPRYLSACAALCDGIPDPSDTSCSGIGCCQTTIVQGLPTYRVQLKDLDQTPYVNQRNMWWTAFIVDRDWFVRNIGAMPNTNTLDDGREWFDQQQHASSKVTSVPTVLEWWLDLERDYDLVVFDPKSGWRCVSSNSFGVAAGGAKCHCSEGYQGNPHILHGCQDIDECQLPVYPCVHGTCINMPGTYRCATKKRIISLPGLITAIAVTAGFGLLFSLMGAAKITNKLKQRRAKKLRQKFFKKNHGLLLQQLISSNNDIAERTRIFSLEELEQATNKFDHNRILGGGGHGTVYKGILSDQRIVAIKKAKIIVQREIDQFINEVVILSQTNHRNVVKLFGCCLETEVPLLVYEFISNGALSFHLHGQSENPLSWKDRLRIALETARAIACLHSAASISVYHRDIKCANILLTDTLTSKVSDFGASRSIAIDETGILTAVQGTYGYLDPEYYYTSRLTEKSDVYSFGVILAELLTRVTPVFSSHSSEGTSLASHFVSHIRDNRFSDILDAQIVEEGGAEDAEVVARLAEACLSLKGEERPTMRQVETVLEDVQNSRVNLSSQITRVNRNATNDQPYKGSKGGEETRLYSLEKEFIESSEIPR
ncbi:wall-associated receptor kinase-like 8 isoform X2 [Aegilops tauschii subsp. strangulata]|uniref:wall-associated receptor kinase-like 8 isoform X2 n=1 Tax=Aegilops tauschii subsp. strangulata TaxID=200361 RepID=UPI00098BB48E|nr:wall-associated receptor kinase-like 8 isoform X2 [Aegilops tauschii subsp. strangulata]